MADLSRAGSEVWRRLGWFQMCCSWSFGLGADLEELDLFKEVVDCLCPAPPLLSRARAPTRVLPRALTPDLDPGRPELADIPTVLGIARTQPRHDHQAGVAISF